jgi:Uma2 family endonuclease
MTLQHPLRARPRPKVGQPTWEVARLYPAQGDWSVAQYLDLDTNHLVEFNDGVLEFLPMPTEFHQYLVYLLSTALGRFVTARALGMVLYAPMKVRIDPKKYREPDILFMLSENARRRHNQYWDGADLVMEVVSPDDPRRDFEEKRADYASAGVSEDWIIDPETRTITVLTLKGERYVERGVYREGRRATSSLLKGFGVDIAKLFKTADAARKSGASDD